MTRVDGEEQHPRIEGPPEMVEEGWRDLEQHEFRVTLGTQIALRLLGFYARLKKALRGGAR